MLDSVYGLASSEIAAAIERILQADNKTVASLHRYLSWSKIPEVDVPGGHH